MNRRHALSTTSLALMGLTVMAADPVVPPDIHPKKLPGTWKTRLGNHVLTVIFTASGTFSGTLQNGDLIDDEFAGTCSIKSESAGGPTLLLWEYSKSRTIPKGTLDRDQIEILNDDFLVIFTQHQERRAFRRMKPSK